MVGRGPRDQSSGQKPRARLPEVLACRAALRFKRANGREAGRAGLPRLLLNRGLNPFLGGVLDFTSLLGPLVTKKRCFRSPR